TSSSGGTTATTAWTAGENAIFSAGTNGTGSWNVTVLNPETVAAFTMEEGTVSFIGAGSFAMPASAGMTITAKGGGAQTTISIPISGSGDLTINSAPTTNNLTTVNLTAVNTFTGNLNLGAGIGASQPTPNFGWTN